MKQLAQKCTDFFSNKIVTIILLTGGFAGASIFISLASTINPWSEMLPHLDCAVWLRCAVGMKMGGTMYVDFWDHKGPILFLIQYLGLSITPHSLTGIWILECISMFLTLYGFYMVARLITNCKLVAFLASVLSLHPLYYCYQEGNCVEEWALPFFTFSLYFFARYLKTGILIKWHILLTGILGASAFLLNGNLISVWVCYAFIIFVKFIYQHKWSDLKTCIVYFGIGLCSIFLLTIIILNRQNALEAFLQAYFNFNYEYTRKADLQDYYFAIMNSAYRDRWFGYVNFFLLCQLLHQKKADWKWSALIYSVISLILLNLSGRQYNHYMIQLLPCMIIPTTSLINSIYKWCHQYKEFLFITFMVSVLWLRFEVNDYKEQITITWEKNGDNYMAGGLTENYTIVNEWINHRWSDDLIEKWVTNDTSY